MGMRLPRYDAQVKPPSQSGNALVEHPEYITAGMKGIGAEVERAGAAGMKLMAAYEEEKQHSEDKVELNKVQTEMIKDSYALKEKYKNDPDDATFADKWDADKKSLEEKYNGMVSDRNKERIQPTMQKHFGVMGAEIGGIKRSKEIARIKDNIYEIGKDHADIIGSIDDFDQREDAIARFYNFLNSVKGREITAKEADSMRKVTLSTAELKKVVKESAIDPVGTYEKLRTDPTANYPYLGTDGIGKAKAIASSAVADFKVKQKAVQDTNNNTATLIAMDDTYETPEGNKIPLTPDLKEQMLKTMLKANKIDDNLYRTLMAYVKPSGGKPTKEGKPSWIYMYRTDEKGNIDKIIVDSKDPDAVLSLMESGYSKGKPAKKKRTGADMLGDVQGNKETAPANTADPLGYYKGKR